MSIAVFRCGATEKVISPIRDAYTRRGRERSLENSRLQRQLEEGQPSISPFMGGLAMEPIQYFGLEEPLRSSSNSNGSGSGRQRRGPAYTSLSVSGDDYLGDGEGDDGDAIDGNSAGEKVAQLSALFHHRYHNIRCHY